MLKEAFQELGSGDGKAFDELSAIVAITESDGLLVDGFDAAIGHGDAEDIAGEIFQDLVAGTGMLGMNDPWFLPHGRRDVLKKAGAFEEGA